MSEYALPNPRESMSVLPGFMQPFLTWMTGMPLAGQSPMFRWSPWGLVVVIAGEILAGLLIGVSVFHAPRWACLFILPVSWVLTTGGVRTLFVVIEHSCTHHIFSQEKIANVVVAEVISVLFWVQSYAEFKSDHATHHRITRLPDDPDTQFLGEWGFYAGMPPRAVCRQLMKTVLSPNYHLKNIGERIYSSFSGSAYKRTAAVAYTLGLLFVVGKLDIWAYWLVIWMFPVVYLFQVSMIINILTEHRWPSSDRKRDLAEVCFGRFCGERVPITEGLSRLERSWRWGKWWVRLAFIYLPYRLFVLVGDEPQHDLHHRQPTSDWANSKFARFDQVSGGRSDKYGEYTDEWGSLIDHVYAAAGTRGLRR